MESLEALSLYFRVMRVDSDQYLNKSNLKTAVSKLKLNGMIIDIVLSSCQK